MICKSFLLHETVSSRINKTQTCGVEGTMAAGVHCDSAICMHQQDRLTQGHAFLWASSPLQSTIIPSTTVFLLYQASFNPWV